MTLLLAQTAQQQADAGHWFAGLQSTVVYCLCILWAIYLLKDLFARKPPLAAILPTLASKAEVEKQIQELRSEARGISERLESSISEWRRLGDERAGKTDARLENIEKAQSTLNREIGEVSSTTRQLLGTINNIESLIHKSVERTRQEALDFASRTTRSH